MITKEQSNVLKAIAIISIVLCHFWGWIYRPSDFVSLLSGSFCQTGVFIFLFLSGYGIMCSYKAKGLNNYWYRRIHKIYIPFLIVMTPQLFLEIWAYRSNISDMYISSTFLSALGLYPNNLLDGTMWFIPFILLQYLIFWCSFRLVSDKKFQKIVQIILTIMGYIILKNYFTWVQENDIYGFAFLMGCFYADFVSKKAEWSKKHILLFCSICYCITLNWYEMFLMRMLNCIFLAVLEIVFVQVIIVQFSCKLHILSWVGHISYELFLTEGIFFWNKILYDLVGYNYLGLLLHLLVIIVMAIMLQKITVIVNKALSGGEKYGR